MAAGLAVSNRAVVTAQIADVRPKYFSPFSVGLLCLLVYVNTVLGFREVGLAAQVVVFVALVSLWFAFVGFRIRSAVFAAVALVPGTQVEGVGYFMLPGMALTLSDLFTVIVILLFLVRPQRLQRTRFTTLLWVLLGVCFLSVTFAANPIAHTGQLIRLGLSISFFAIILGSPDDTLKRPVFYALLVWPFVVLVNIAGLEYLWQFLTFGEGQALNLAKTGEVLLGSHLVVMCLFFLVPLAAYLNAPRFVWCMLLLYLLILSVFSNSRSLVIGLGLGMFLYIFFASSAKKRSLVQIVAVIALAGGLVFGVATLGFFNFGADVGSKSVSSFVRIAKIEAAFLTYLNNPVLGIGYGAAAVVDGNHQKDLSKDSNPDFLMELINVKAGAETTPPQILAETGTLGGVVSLLILALGFQRMVQLLRDRALPFSVKLNLLALVIMFFIGFLGGNSYAMVPFFMAMPFVFGNTRWG
jgi:O-antigen ligase